MNNRNGVFARMFNDLRIALRLDVAVNKEYLAYCRLPISVNHITPELRRVILSTRVQGRGFYE